MMLSKISFISYILSWSTVLIISSCDANPGDYVCPPCDQSCDALTFAKPGICPHCQMTLVKKSGLLAEHNMVIDEVHIDTGSGMFKISGGFGHEESVINVYYHMPDKYTDSSKILIVIPGAGRNGDSYRDSWIEASEKYGILILSPMYDVEHYPFEEYHLCGLITDINLSESITYEDGTNQVLMDEAQLDYNVQTKESQWIFRDFDRLFDMVREQLQNQSSSYDIFGHSAGGQILHRMTLFHQGVKANRIIASNSGFYTLPDTLTSMPFGLRDHQISNSQLKRAFENKLVILIGELDNQNETRGTLLRSRTVDLQGIGRLERAKYFYDFSKRTAEKMNAAFSWKIDIVPGVGHEQQLMAEAAASILYNN